MTTRVLFKTLLSSKFASFVLALSILYAQCEFAIAQKAAPAQESLIGSCHAIRTRIERDHRIRIVQETYKGERRLDVYLYLSEQPLPYVVSLGWFTAKQDASHAAQAAEFMKKKLGGLVKKKDAPQPFEKDAELLNAVSDKIKDLVVVDELGLILPPVGSSPPGKNFDKADWHCVVGFDHLSQNNLSGAEKEFNEAIKIAPVNARFSNNLGAMLAARGDYSNASPHFDRAIRENESYAAAYANRSLLSLAIGQPLLALDDAEKALKLLPNLIPGRIAYIRALMETGKADEALKLAQALKAEAPSEWQSMLLLGDTLLASHQYKDACTSFERLSVLSPGNADILLKLAHAEEKSGDLDQAIKAARKATQIAPNDPRTHVTLARYLDANRDANGARLQYERALDLKPERSLRKSAMGAILRLLIAAEKLPDADEFSKKWVKQYPEDSECHFNRAWIASQLGGEHVQESIDEYTRALELQPTLTSAHYNLALVLLKAGKNAQALKELKTFVEGSPQDADSEQARELIKKLEGNG